ncbi:MAG TPA: FecR domain-containing protein [Nitrosomonas sp.]|nr:FecR domain-containing protein [Nitrosomonas sp.]
MMIYHNKPNLKSLLSFLFLQLFVFFSHKCFAETQLGICKSQSLAQLASVQGELWIDVLGTGQWQLVDQAQLLCEGSRIKVGANSRASLLLPNNILLRLDEGTVLTLKGIAANEPTLLDLLKGFIHFLSRTPTRLEITTPIANAGPEGTEFALKVDDQAASLWVYEGSVKFFNPQGSLQLNPGEAAQALLGQAPHTQLDVKPLDAVQWALYYPAIIDPRVIEQQLPQTLQATVRESLEHYRQGNTFEALAALETLDQNTLSAQLLTYRAGLYLTLGRVAEARHDIAQTLQLQPNDSEAYALQAIITVVQNDKVAALQLAEQAINADRTSPTARLALSYAYQAHFQIEEALASVEEALRLDGKNALVWARLSELQMSTGYLDRALESAQQAVSLNPNLGKTQTVLGFAHLLQIDTTQAKATFTKAIQLDQADPMPRLGLGLALIREGQLEAGRIELEIAASLDPANSLVRSYLGKAYFEEKRYGLAETQFDLAKARDPNDPTPWFYDAIQKQTQNRPVEALRDIQKSIELNNNRAVYRSKLLLDKDEAARGSSLARIYDNLGFEKRAIMETAKSLSHDPGNHSAHRFLADAYVNIPRHEIARVSELLQAQLLQPINVNPVQPRLAVADLNIITGTGPAALGFNEFAPLTERNKPQVVASGLFGSNSTLGNEVVASAVYDKASISVGQFHYDTKGFRQNNDQTHNVYNAFMQYALTPKLNVQAELRTRGTEHGDLIMDFGRQGDPTDPPNFTRNRRALNEDIARVGARYAISPKQDVLFSGQYVNRDENLKFFSSDDITSKIKDEGYQTEAQHLLRGTFFNLVSGLGAYRTDVNNIRHVDFTRRDGEACKSSRLNNDFCDPDLPGFTRERTNGYVYANVSHLKNMNWTFGLSYDAYKEFRDFDVNSLNPKFGLQANITNFLRLRLAWFETVKSALIANQTLEPTQIAGFNQFFDDVNGTKSQRKGIGLDANFTKDLYSGVEYSERDLEAPQFNGPGRTTQRIPNSIYTLSSIDKQHEKLFRTYLYWLPISNWVVRSEFQYEHFERDQAKTPPLEVNRINTLSTPINISYFDPSGLFAGMTTTFVLQDIERSAANLPEDQRNSAKLNAGMDSFFLWDTVLGFRMPNRRGVLSLEGRNLLDQDFLYRSINFQQSEAIASRFIPSRTIFLRLTLNF